MNIKDEGLIQKAMEKKWTLDRFLEEAGRRGDLREEVRDMREEFKVARIQDSRTHHRGRGRSRGNFRRYQERPIPNPHRDSQQDCVYCGKSHPFGRRDLCTASGKRCSKCGRWNHFASVCKSGQTHTKETPPQGYSERKSSDQRSQSSRGNRGEYRNQGWRGRSRSHAHKTVEAQGEGSDSDDSDFIRQVAKHVRRVDNSNHKVEETIKLRVNDDIEIDCEADSGATTNILDEYQLLAMQRLSKSNIVMKPTIIKLETIQC